MTITRLAALLIAATIAGMLAGAHGVLWLSDRVSAASGQIPEPNGLLHVSDGQAVESWRFWNTAPFAGVSGKCWLGPRGAWFDESGVRLPPTGKEKAMSEREQFIIRHLTAAMRKADDIHRDVGGGTRHYVRDCLLPILGDYDICVTLKGQNNDLADERIEQLEAERRELAQALKWYADYFDGRPNDCGYSLGKIAHKALAKIDAPRVEDG